MKTLALLLAMSVGGCATMISGTTQEISIKSIPSDSGTIVFGAPLGPLLVKGKELSDMMKITLRILQPFASKEELAWMEKIDFESFVTSLLMDSQSGKMKAATKKVEGNKATVAATEGLSKLDKQRKKALLKYLGFEEVGTTPIKTTLGRGNIYAVVGYKSGRKLRIVPVDSDINWVILLNVFNLGFGVFVDVATGAWTDLSPEKVVLDLRAKAESIY